MKLDRNTQIPSKQFGCNLLSEMLPHGSKRAKCLFLQKFNLKATAIPSTFSTDLWAGNPGLRRGQIAQR